MPDHYSPRLFLQQIPNKLLREFFARRDDELAGLDWDALEEGDIDPVLNAWHALPLAQQADVEYWFRAVANLATKEGLRTVIEECQFHRLNCRNLSTSFRESTRRFSGCRSKPLVRVLSARVRNRFLG